MKTRETMKLATPDDREDAPQAARASPGWLRSIGAIFAGLLAIVILSTGTDAVMLATHIFPASGEPKGNMLWLLATEYRVVYSIFGCWLAARLAPVWPMRHALVLGVIGVLLSTAGAIFASAEGTGFTPTWYPLALIAVSLPCAWIGGRLHGMRAALRQPA